MIKLLTATMYVTYSIALLSCYRAMTVAAAATAVARPQYCGALGRGGGAASGLEHFDSSWNTIIMMSPLAFLMLQQTLLQDRNWRLIYDPYQGNYCNYFGDS